MALAAINLAKWIEEHRDVLKPPVGNAMVYKDGEFQVMATAGPNSRTDYHCEPGEELFYQLTGGITLKLIEDGVMRDVHIREGELFLLPANVIHSPRRPAGTHTVGDHDTGDREAHDLHHPVGHLPMGEGRDVSA